MIGLLIGIVLGFFTVQFYWIRKQRKYMEWRDSLQYPAQKCCGLRHPPHSYIKGE